MLFAWKMEHCYSEDLFSDYELSSSKIFSSNGWKFTRKKPSACHECRKTFSKKKSWEKNYETLLKFSQRWENIHCKIFHHKITLFNNIFGHLALFSGLITWNLISDWYMDMLIHLPFRFHSSSLSLIIQLLFRGIVCRNKRLKRNRNICWFCVMMHCKSSSFHPIFIRFISFTHCVCHIACFYEESNK